ncbi:MAG: sulfite exporter TauE/SafE family protein [Planctomycetota bacterium]|nr:sulfite exporter TauE/SafE family protein [Planctomycetota bacterium]
MADLTHADPTVLALAGTVLATSLLGSAHCAGMCGGLALVASGPGDAHARMRQLGYHGGRLVSYALVGVVAGVVGGVVDDAGVLVGVQRVAAIAAGSLIACFGAIAIARAFGARIPGAGVPRALVSLAQRVHARTLRLPPAWRGVPLGLATPLLPCGWLYAFAAIAAASATPLMGALVMAAFWLGTVPALVLAASGARFLFARLGRAAPVIAGIAMVAVGLHAAVARGGLAEVAMSEVRAVRASDRAPANHALIEQVESVADEVPPCCRGKAATCDE